MPKSQIIKDLVEDAVPLEKSLNRLFVLAKDISNNQLAVWAIKELNGYSTKDDIPEYRKTKNLKLMFTGFIRNVQVSNVPLQTSILSAETIESIQTIIMYDGIRYISELASSENAPSRTFPSLINEIAKATGNAMQCVSISQVVPLAFLQSICSSVKEKMITALLEMEKKYGNLDGLGVDITKKNQIQIDADNAVINRAAFSINMPSTEPKKEKWYSKIAWNIVVPIITGVLGAVLGAIAVKQFRL